MALFGRKKNEDTQSEQDAPAVATTSDDHGITPDVAEKEEDIKDLLEDVDVPPGQAGSAPADHPGAGSDITAPDTSTDLNSSGPTIIHPHAKDEDEPAEEITPDEPAEHDDALANNEEAHEEVSSASNEASEEPVEASDNTEDEASHGIDIKTDDEPAEDNEDSSEPESTADEKSHDSPSSNEVVEDVDREVNDLVTRLSNEVEGLDSEIANSEAKIKELQSEIDGHKARKDEIDKKVAALKAVVDGSSK